MSNLNLRVGNGRAVHRALTDAAGVAFATACGAEGRRQHSRRVTTADAITCQRCDPAATGQHRAPAAPAQDLVAVHTSLAASAEGYANEYREMIALATARGADTADLEATLARHQERAAAARAAAEAARTARAAQAAR